MARSSAPGPGSPARSARPHWPELAPSRRELLLWFAVVAALVADLALTAQGIREGYAEANPFAQAALAHAGILGFAFLKGSAVAFAVVVRSLVPERYASVVPVTLLVPWSTAAGVNVLILTVI